MPLSDGDISNFDILPISQFAGSSAAIRRPKEIAYFSYDDNHNFHLDERSLRYYYTPTIGADLCKGFDIFQQVDDSADDHLDSLLETLIDLERRTGSKCEADIVTWRGMMTKIMATPFDNMAGFEMNATRFQDTIFIEENHAHKLASRQQQHAQQPSRAGQPSQDMMSYWGYKFETLSLLPTPWNLTSREFIESREDMVVSNAAQYCSVVKTGIGKTKLILGGEVDAVWDSKPEKRDGKDGGGGGGGGGGGPINWVELKTSAEIVSERDVGKYERKLMKFWIQSFLLGVPKIVVGFRSPEGVLRRVEELETQDLPGMVKGRGRGGWDGNVCIGFAASFLDWLRTVVVGEGVWRVRRLERSPVVEVYRVEETGVGNVLSRSFVDWRTKGRGDGDDTEQIGGLRSPDGVDPVT